MIITSSLTLLFFKVFSAFSSVLYISIIIKAFGVVGYGQQTLLIASAAMLKIFPLHWTCKALMRHADLTIGDSEKITGNIVKLHFLISVTIFTVSLVLYSLLGNLSIITVSLLAISESLKECCLEIFRANLKFILYGLFAALSNIAYLVCAMLFIRLDITINHLLIYTSVVICILYGKLWFDNFKITLESKIVLNAIKYGFPIALSDSVSQGSFAILRFCIGNNSGIYFLGRFSALYDIIQRSIVAYLQIINGIFFPLIRKAWDRKSWIEVESLCRSNVFLIIFPTAIASLIASSYSNIWLPLIGITAQRTDYAFILLVAFGIVVNRLKSFHVDYYFLLIKHTSFIVKNTICSMSLLLILTYFSTNYINEYSLASIIAASYFVGFLLALLRVDCKKYLLFNLTDILVIFLTITVIYLVHFVLYYKGVDPSIVTLLLVCASMIIMKFCKFAPLAFMSRYEQKR